jgi:hypothetical protein
VDPLWPVWTASLKFTIEADHELVAKQKLRHIEEYLNQMGGVHVLGATVVRNEGPDAA